MKPPTYAPSRIAILSLVILLVTLAAGLTSSLEHSAAAGASQLTVTLPASGDATLKSWEPDSNFGGDTTLELSFSTIDVTQASFALLRFDLSTLPADAIIDSASLELNLTGSAGADPVTIGAYYVYSDWDESTVTWNTPLDVAGIGVGASIDAGTGYKAWWGISGFVQGWRDGPNNGLQLRGPISGDPSYYERIFGSRDGRSNHPRLDVTYHLPEPTATSTATATTAQRPTSTRTPTPTATRAPTASQTATRTRTATVAVLPSPTFTRTRTPTRTQSPAPHTLTPTPTRTATRTPTATLLPGCPDLLVNGGFETGGLAPWGSAGPTGVSGPGRNSEFHAWLGGQDNVDAEIFQEVTLPRGAAPVRLAFWWRADATSEQEGDVLNVLMQWDEHAEVVHTLRAIAPLGQWRYAEVDLSAYAGRTVFVTFHAHTDDARPTTFRVDDVALLACGLPTATPTKTRTPTAAPAVITFEEAIPNPDTVRTQYCNNPATNKGVEFIDGGRIYAPNVQTQSLTHAFTNRFPGEEFGTNKTVAIRFTTGQSLVGVKVGLDRSYGAQITAQMRAYSSATPGTGFLTYNTQYLGYGPASITQDLAVTSASSNIRSVVIEFQGATPNYYAYEAIDDLRFSTIGPPCISDTTAPSVQITQPAANGQTFQSPAMDLAFIANDGGTGVAKIQVAFLNAAGSEVGSFYVCGAAAAPVCIYDVFPHTASYNFNTTLPANTAKIRVKAWDFAGQAGQAERTINWVPIGYFNLWAQAMEISQATQPWLATNSQATLSGATPPTFSYPSAPPTFSYPSAPTAVPLAAERTTAVRVYAGVAGTTGNVQLDNVRAQLRCFTGATYQIPCPGYQWINPQSLPPNSNQITIRPNDSLDTKRRDARLSWNFILPESWTAAGKIYLEAVILPPYGLQECAGCDDAANRLRVSGVPFQTVPDFTTRVHFVRIRRQLGGQIFEPTQAQMDAHVADLRPLYPVDEATLPTVPDATWIWNDCGNTCDADPQKNLGVRCNRVHSDLVQAFPNKANKLAVYALIDNGFPCAGVGGGGYSYGGANRPDSFAHEVGHAVGLNHAGPPPGHGSLCPPPGGGNCAECNPASWCDTDWPWPHGTLGTFGFNVFKMSVIVPGTTEADPHDYMSYGGPTKWVSSRTWIRTFNAFAGQSLPYPKSSSVSNTDVTRTVGVNGTTQEPRSYLLVGGEQGSDGGWLLGPAYELEFPAGTADAPGAGDYSLALLDSNGMALFVRRFALTPGHIDMLDRSSLAAPLTFVELLPLPEGTRALVLRQGESILAIAERSPNAPEVEILSPTEAGFVGPSGATPIRWIGYDADGDPLRYLVQYQAREEDEWQTLATNWTATELAIDTADLPGGEAGRVRVLATDGLNTGVAVSAGFLVPNKPPQARILPPVAELIQAGDRLKLVGTASDLEDGLLPEAALAWRSDRDGPLGTGRQLDTVILSVGTHIITLEARDRAGQVGTTAVAIEVTARPNAQPLAEAGPGQVTAGQCAPVLTGRASLDPDGDPLVFLWTIVQQPAGGHAWLDDPEGPTTRFFADRSGQYAVELTVHDGQVASAPDRVVVNATGSGATRICAYLPLILRTR